MLLLKVQRDKLRIHALKLSKIVTASEDAARSLLRSQQKEHALRMLRRRNQNKQLLEDAESQMDHIAGMIQTIENAAVQADVVRTLALSTETLKRMNQEMSVDHVKEVMQEAEEAREAQKEIAGALASAPLSEALIEEELEALMAQAISFPAVPTAALLLKPDRIQTKIAEPVHERIAVPSSHIFFFWCL